MTPRPLGTPFADLLGLIVTHWWEDEARLEMTIVPSSRNLAGVLAGGVIATLIDVACSMAGSYPFDHPARRRVVSLNLNVNYIGSAAEGTVRVHGRKRGGGKSVFMSYAEVTDDEDRVIATGQGVFKYVADQDAKP